MKTCDTTMFSQSLFRQSLSRAFILPSRVLSLIPIGVLATTTQLWALEPTDLAPAMKPAGNVAASVPVAVQPEQLQLKPIKEEAKTRNTIQTQVINAKATVWRGNDPTASEAIPSNLSLKATFPDRNWWEHFHDENLTRYIDQALRGNLNLQVAEQRVLEARALTRQTLGKELPQVYLQPSFSRSRSSATSIPRFGGGGATTAGTAQSAGNSGGLPGNTSAANTASTASGFFLGRYINSYSAPLVASYEADLWHRLRDTTRATNKQAEAAVHNLQSARAVLAADVATAYFNLIANDKLIEQQKAIIATGEADLAHAQRLYDAGASDQENVVLRQGRLTDFKAQLQDSYAAQALALHQLAVLMGQTPYAVGQLTRTDWERYTIPDEVAVGLPAELLLRRPDILAVEDQLAAEGYTLRAVRKELYPQIIMSGQFGFSTANFKELFNWESYVASTAATLLQPLFTGGQKKANIRVHKARYQAQLLTYRNAVLQSYREVDDSLSSLKSHRNAYQEYAVSLGFLNQREQIQQNRLTAGAIAEAELNPVLLEVIQAQQGLTRTKLAALTDTVSLYKALGGGY
jgi:NodT family efflux transporter outer membrane factor (OMF) lipoprotein